MLYAGTETGLYVSLDDGASWRRWHSNLPVTPIYDLQVKGSDLVIATHGRSFWILDDLTPLHQTAQSETGDSPTLFMPRASWRLLPDIFDILTTSDGKDYSVGLGKAATYVASRDENGLIERKFLDAGESAAQCVIVYYHLSEDIAADAAASLRILDAAGNAVREFHPKPADYESADEADKAYAPGPWMPARAGVNRFVWDARHTEAKRLHGNKTAFEAERGPLALPGSYRVELSVAGETTTQPFQLVNDPRSPATLDELEQQLTLLLKIRDKLSDLYLIVKQLRSIRGQLQNWLERLCAQDLHDSIRGSAKTLVEKLDSIESMLILPGEQLDLFGLHDRVRLNAALASVISVIESADTKPTTQAVQLSEQYLTAIDEQLGVFTAVLDTDLVSLNDSIREAGLTAVHDGR